MMFAPPAGRELGRFERLRSQSLRAVIPFPRPGTKSDRKADEMLKTSNKYEEVENEFD